MGHFKLLISVPYWFTDQLLFFVFVLFFFINLCVFLVLVFSVINVWGADQEKGKREPKRSQKVYRLADDVTLLQCHQRRAVGHTSVKHSD